MSDDFDEIAKLLKNTPAIKPSEEAKNLAISKAMQEFDKKSEKTFQGISFGNRLIVTVQKLLPTVLETIRGEFFMKKAYRYVVVGGVFAGILTVSLMSSTYLSSDLLPQVQKIAYENKDGRRVDAIAINGLVQSSKPQAQELQQELAKNVSGSADGSAANNMPAPAMMPEPAKAKEARGREVAADSAMQQAPKAELKSLAKPIAPSMPAVSSSMAIDGATANYGYVVASPAFYPPNDGVQSYYKDEGRDKFADVKQNSIKLAKEEPVSTFSIDVDTASYSFMRASLNNNVLPQKDSVRVEEMVNYFPYEYEVPKDKAEPFKTSVSVFPTPWNKETKLLHIGIKGYQIEQKEKPHTNLVFLLDTSGSMNEPNKLPLLQNSMKLLLDSLQADDTVAIVTYAGNAGVALEPTKVKDKNKILSVLDSLSSGGSTAGAEGIRTAYQLAEQNFDKNGVNRVILATDGDFNVGITDPNELKSFVERKRSTGVFLSVFGFGMGNYNDAMMQTLAQNGNGNAAYIDNLSEARKALVEESSSTLFTIAKDVKIQVEFNPEKVAEYRLIGYETRMLNREDFNNDKVDAGDIGAGHAVTAIYEITPTDSKAKLVDDSRYQKAETKPETKDKSGEYAFVKIRYKLPSSDTSKLITTVVDSKVEAKNIEQVGTDARFATSVAAFAQLLRGDSFIKSYSYDEVIALAESAKGADKFGYRSEFINLIRLAKNAPALKPLN